MAKTPKPDKKPKSAKNKGPGEGISWEEFFTNFSFANLSRLNETQIKTLAIVAVAGGVLLYNFVFAVEPVVNSDDVVVPLSAPLQAPAGETEEQRFKRENKNAQLADGSKVPADYVQNQTRLTRQIPFGDRETEFIIRLPSDWVVSNFARYGLPSEEKYTVLTNIARYYGPAVEDVRPFMWVEVERLKRYITAQAYASAYMLKRGIAPITFLAPDTRMAQALYVEVRDFHTYAMRTLFQVQGDLMVMASFGVPIEGYQQYKDIMGLSLNSFQLIRPVNKNIEDIRDYKLLNVVKFQHYASWLPKNEKAESTLRPSLELHNPQEVNNPKGDLLQGLIMVHAWRKGNQTEKGLPMQDIRDRLQELSMVLKDPVSKTVAMPVRDNFTSINQTQYEALVNTYFRKDEYDIIKSEESFTKQEVWVTVMDNGYYEMYLVLVTPLKDTNYTLWAQNWAAYELLLKSLEVRGFNKQ